MSEVNIKYLGSSLATMDASGEKTIEAAGHYFPADLIVEYDRPSGGGGITPSGLIQLTDLETHDVTQYAQAQYVYDHSVPIIRAGELRPDLDSVATHNFVSGTQSNRWRSVVNDDGVTIPAYTTSATALVASTSKTPLTLTLNNYDYVVLYKLITRPVYSTSTPVKGRQEYLITTSSYEIVSFPSGTFRAANGTTYNTRNSATTGGAIANKYIYWSSATALALYTSGAYGAYQTIVAPTLSSAYSNTPTITIKTPSVNIRGHATYLPSGVWSTITDIEYFYYITIAAFPKLVNRPNGGLLTSQQYACHNWMWS